jgi:hypothetical protein
MLGCSDNTSYSLRLELCASLLEPTLSHAITILKGSNGVTNKCGVRNGRCVKMVNNDKGGNVKSGQGNSGFLLWDACRGNRVRIDKDSSVRVRVGLNVK